MVRIAVDLQMLAPGALNGGIKPLILRQVRRLREWHPGRFEFIFLVNQALAPELELAIPGCRLVCVSKRAEPLATRPGMRLSLRGRWALRQADLLYAPVWFSPFHSRRRPTIAMFADMLHRDHPEMLSGESERLWREEIVKFSVRTAARIQTISDTMVERIRQHYGVQTSRLLRTYPPREKLLESAPEGQAARERSGFLYPANSWPHKNHERLLLAYSLYRQRAGTGAWPLVLTGHENPERKAVLEARARELGLSAQHLQFCGFLGDREFAAIWEKTGALVFPSLYEGFGMPLIEAMNSRVPIAASGIPATTEVAGESALLFEPSDPASIADAMFQMSSRPDLRAGLATRGAIRLQMFDDEKEIGTLAGAFQAAVQEFRSSKIAR
jgi:glycosyltransferase involved in cell wall biosynthesis